MFHRISLILLVGFMIFHLSMTKLSFANIISKNSSVNIEALNLPKEDIINIDEELGQNIIVGIPYTFLDSFTESILRMIKPAGIVLYQRNFDSFEQIKDLINQLQTISKEESKCPYFIMLDEEPDGANRMGLLKNIFTLGNPNWAKIERDIVKLSKIGINVELAPLADFPFVPNSFISKRLKLESKEDLIAFNKTFISLLNKYNICATLKHFPGLGLISDDPHYKFIQNVSNKDMIDQSISIFQSGIESGASFVMTCHVIYDALDPNNPATFSSYIVTDNLRNKLGFEGMVVTDDLSDMPLSIQGLDLVDAGIQSLKAGHNLIMFSHNLPRTKEIVEGILLEASKDKELLKIIKSNYIKVTSFKNRYLVKNE